MMIMIKIESKIKIEIMIMIKIEIKKGNSGKGMSPWALCPPYLFIFVLTPYPKRINADNPTMKMSPK